MPFLVILVFAGFLALLGVDAWVIQMNVNDIFAYYSTGRVAPFWPFFWILLFTGGTAGIFRSSK